MNYTIRKVLEEAHRVAAERLVVASRNVRVAARTLEDATKSEQDQKALLMVLENELGIEREVGSEAIP